LSLKLDLKPLEVLGVGQSVVVLAEGQAPGVSAEIWSLAFLVQSKKPHTEYRTCVLAD